MRNGESRKNHLPCLPPRLAASEVCRHPRETRFLTSHFSPLTFSALRNATLGLSWTLLLLLWSAAASLGQEATTATAPAAEDAPPPVTQPAAPPEPEHDAVAGAELLAPVILPAPANNPQIAERLKMVQDLLQVYPTTQPATQPASQPAEETARQQAATLWPLVEVLRQYQAELENWQRIRADSDRLGSPETINKIRQDIEKWNQRREHYLSLQREEIRYVWLSRLDEIEKEFNEQNAELQRLIALRTTREQQLSVLPRQRGETEAAVRATLEELRKYLSGLATTDLPAKLVQAQSREERELLLVPKRVHEWRHNLQLLRAAVHTDLGILLERAQPLNADRIAALTGYVNALHDYRLRLETIRTQSEVEYATEQLARPDLPPHGRTYWELRMTAAEGLAEFQHIAGNLPEVISQADADRIEQRIKRGEYYLSLFTELLERRQGQSILQSYHMAGEYLSRYEAQLRECRSQFDQVTDQLRIVQERRDQIRERVRVGREKLEQQITALQGDELMVARERQATLTGDLQSRLHATLDGVVDRLEVSRERLRKTIPLLEEHVARLRSERSGMYRSYLLKRDRGPLRQDWAAVGKEWESLRTGEGKPAEPLRALLHREWESFRAVPAGRWLTVAILVFLTAVGASAVRHRLNLWLRKQEPQALVPPALPAGGEAAAESPAGEPAAPAAPPDPSPPEPICLLDRLEIQGVRILAWTAVPICTLLMLLACHLAVVSEGFVLSMPAGLLAGTVVAVLVFATISAIFDPSRPAFRLVRCDDAVARYHRRWLWTIGLFVVVTVPPRVVLYVIDSSLVLGYLWWDVCTVLFLILVTVYLLPRRRFFPSLDAGGKAPDLRSALYVRCFPLLTLCTVALIGLELVGYAPLTDYLLSGLLATVGVFLLVKLVRSLIAAWGRAGASEPPTADEGAAEVPMVAGHPLLPLVVQLFRLAVFVGGLVLALGLWGISPWEINAFLQRGLINTTAGPITTWRLLLGVLAVILGVLASRTLRSFLETDVFPQTRHLDRGTQAAVLVLLHYSVIALAIYIGLNLAHIDLGALTILLGTFGLGLGLGLQPLFVNFISGLMILLERQIKVGDIVEIDGKPGEVLAISMRSTRIRAPDNIELIVPNGEFISGRVTNWTLSDQVLRARLEVGVAYGSDVQLVRKLLLDIAYRHPNALVDPAPQVWFMNFGANSLDFVLVCWFGSPGSRWEFLSQIRFEVTKVFEEHGINIPFPQRTLSFLNDKPIPIEVRRPARAATPADEAPAAGDADEAPPPEKAG